MRACSRRMSQAARKGMRRVSSVFTITTSIPRVFRTKSWLERLATETQHEHDFLAIINVNSRFYSRPLRIYILLCSVLGLMFIDAVVFNTAFPKVECGGHLDELHRVAQTLIGVVLRDGPALDPIRIEQRIRRPAIEHPGDPPHESVNVLNAGIEPEAAGRRKAMRRSSCRATFSATSWASRSGFLISWMSRMISCPTPLTRSARSLSSSCPLRPMTTPGRAV